jgi:hypothetical protein
MRITFSAGGSPERQAFFREWWWRNGILHSEPTGPVRVDLNSRTVTYWQILDDPEPGDLDFPERRRDIENAPLAEERVVPLFVDPPVLLLSERPIVKVA